MKKICLTLIILGFLSLSSSCQTKFDQKIWLENDDFLKTDNPRLNMIDDITNNHLKIGMNKKKILKLLGKPYSDTIGVKLPKGLKPPDSLSNKNIFNKPSEKRDYYIDLLNKWYKENYEPIPLITYVVGWSVVDPIFLEIELNAKNEVVEFWTKEY